MNIKEKLCLNSTKITIVRNEKATVTNRETMVINFSATFTLRYFKSKLFKKNRPINSGVFFMNS